MDLNDIEIDLAEWDCISEMRAVEASGFSGTVLDFGHCVSCPSGEQLADGSERPYKTGVMKGANSRKTPLSSSANSGEQCPESGVWKVAGKPSKICVLPKGSTMPKYNGKMVRWILIQYD